MARVLHAAPVQATPDERFLTAGQTRRGRCADPRSSALVGFVVGRLLSGRNRTAGAIHETTTYCLLHRHDCLMKGAPSGAVILSWLSCNLKDADLLERNDLLVCGKSKQQGDTDDMNRESGVSNRECRLGRWSERRSLASDSPTLAAGQPGSSTAFIRQCTSGVKETWPNSARSSTHKRPGRAK